MKFRLLGLELFQADGRTDMKKLIFTFRILVTRLNTTELL